MQHLVNKVVIFTLVNNVAMTGLVEGMYKKYLILKIPINVEYRDDVRQPTLMDYAISSVKKVETKEATVMRFSNYSTGYSKKEFTYHMLPIENVLKYEVSKEDLINIIAKDK